MSKSTMAPATLSIVSQAVDLSAHVGHKVTVSGTAAGPDRPIASYISCTRCIPRR
jgi:hypothetical protein